MPYPTTTADPLPTISASDLIDPLLKVGDVMTPDPRTCSPVSTVLEAAMFMRDANCGVVPVTEAGRPVGVVTDRDIAMSLPDHEDDLARVPVSEVMTDPLVTVDRDATLESAVEKLGEEGVGSPSWWIPAGMLVGILSWTDLVPQVSECGIGRVVSRLVENR